MDKSAIVYYKTGPYSDVWPYLMVGYDKSLKPTSWKFEDELPGIGALEFESIPVEIIESIQEQR